MLFTGRYCFARRLNPARAKIESVGLKSRSDHRHDAGLDRLGQLGPGGHDGGQGGVRVTDLRQKTASSFACSRETV
jgi:hypothetical protein